MKILHLAHYDEKFIKVVADIFNSYDGASNLFLVFSADVPAAQKFFANLNHIRVVDNQYIYSKFLDEDLDWCDCLVVHYLDPLKARVIMRAPKDLPIVWSGWGADYYSLIAKGEKNLLGKKTQQLVKSLIKHRSVRGPKMLRWVKNVVRLILLRRIRHAVRLMLDAQVVKKAIKRANYFSSPFPEDFELLKTHLGPDWLVKYVRVFYGSAKVTYMPGPEHIYGNNILVGNSATPTNNHLEVFDMLAQIDLGGRQIIAPLSYGDPIYREAIISYGRNLFGSRFKPIVEFMPLEQYNTLIAGCSVAVMGHRRQQGGGNTVTALYKGARVFLDEANTVYQYLKSQGAFVNNLKELQTDGVAVFVPLTEDQKRKNREVLEDYAGHEMVMRSVGELVELVKKYGVNKHA